MEKLDTSSSPAYWKKALTRLVLLTSLPPAISFFASLWWLFDLSTHFRIQYVCVLSGALLILMALKSWKSSLWIAALLIFNLSMVLPFYGQPQKKNEAKEYTTSLKLIAYNLYSGNRQKEKVIEFLQQSKAEVIFLQEIDRFWEKQLESLKETYPYSFGVARSDNFGIYCLSKLSFQKKEIFYASEEAYVPTLIAEVEHEGVSFLVVGTHPTPPVSAKYSFWRNEQLQVLAKKIKDFSKPVVLAGDLNVTSWSPHFQKLLQVAQLKDTRYGYGVQNTWPYRSRKTFIIRIPIDHCLVSSDIWIENRTIGSSMGSDHRPVILDFCLKKAPGK